MTKLSFHCYSKSGDFDPHKITFNADNHTVTCSCPYFAEEKFCSHIDATILAGERHMVPEDEWDVANEIMVEMYGKIKQPSNWAASWRFSYKWRGIDKLKKAFFQDNRPTVCFTGKNPKAPDKSRNDYFKDAEDKGFRPIRKFCNSVQIVVAESPLLNTAKIRGAADLNLPVISYDDWEHLTSDGEIVDNVEDVPKQTILPQHRIKKYEIIDKTTSFHCNSRSSDIPHIIAYDPNKKTVTCDCECFKKFGFCAHIDATVLSSELNMVPTSEWEIVYNIAYTMRNMRGHLSIPENWQQNWKRNLKWLGRYKRESGDIFKPKSVSVHDDGRPTVLLLGQGAQYQNISVERRIEEVSKKGFRLIFYVTPNVDIIVVNPDDHARYKSNNEYNKEALDIAEERHIPVLTYEEWEEFTKDGENIPD